MKYIDNRYKLLGSNMMIDDRNSKYICNNNIMLFTGKIRLYSNRIFRA